MHKPMGRSYTAVYLKTWAVHPKQKNITGLRFSCHANECAIHILSKQSAMRAPAIASNVLDINAHYLRRAYYNASTV